MGTYSELHPPKAAIGSLIDLVTWVMGKDSLNPLGTYSHPWNNALPYWQATGRMLTEFRVIRSTFYLIQSVTKC
jgi:hypothetical protein